MLAARITGDGPPLVALHGFSHTSEQFSGLAAAIGRRVVAFDLPGHGQSRHASTEFAAVIDAVRDGIEAIGEPVALLGYSQGARIALATALTDPSGVDALILISGTPGIEDEKRRSERAAADAALADRIVSAGLEAFLDGWTGTGLTSTTHRAEPDRRQDRVRRLANTADGLAAALVGYGQGAQPSLWGEIGRIDIPSRFIVGSRDDRYREIARRMQGEVVGSDVVVIDGAGHDPLGDRPEATASAVSAFLDGLS